MHVLTSDRFQNKEFTILKVVRPGRIEPISKAD